MSLLKTRKDLFEIFLQKKELYYIREYVCNSLSVEILSPEDDRLIHQYHDFRKKWQSVDRLKNKFLFKYSKWLNCTIAFGILATPSTSSVSSGRHIKNFEECSERTKRRKTEGIRKLSTDSELIYATQMSLRNTGQTMLANIFKEMVESPSSKLEEFITYWKKNKVHIIKYSEDEALALLIRNHLSKRAYCDIQKGGKCKNANIYPTYNKILLAKERLPCKSLL